ncbi:MAG: hypothetical protein ACYTCV_08625 [Planctomycetota bacterium]|jgi:hypothetical protein
MKTKQCTPTITFLFAAIVCLILSIASQNVLAEVYEEIVDPNLKEADCAAVISTTAQASAPGIGGPDAGGYTYIDNQEPGGPAFDWIEISGTGTNLGLGDDTYYFPVNLPYSFDFYGTNYSQIGVDSNGGICFGQEWMLFVNDNCIPGTNDFGNDKFIALYWDDLYPGYNGGAVYYKIIGDAPNRKLVVQWQNVAHCCGSSGGYVTAQAQLHENGDILLLYANPSSEAGAWGTVGIQNSPTVGLQYSCNQAALSSGLAVLFTRNLGCSEPEVPAAPQPGHNAIDVSTDTMLQWNGGTPSATLLDDTPAHSGNDSGTTTTVSTITEEEQWLAAHPGEVFPLAAPANTDTQSAPVPGSELVGIDFDNIAGSPTNWTRTTGGSTPYSLLNLQNETGTNTMVDLRLDSTGGALSNYSTAANSSTIPIHTNAIAGLSDYFYGSGNWTFTFSDLQPGNSYNVYVFGLRGFELGNNITISGGLSSIHFTQNSTIPGTLWINGEQGSNTRTLESYAELMTADINGEIIITVEAPSVTTAAIAGLAIEPTGSSSDLTYDVYFGTHPNTMNLIHQDTEIPTYSPGPLAENTDYYWQVIAKNQCGQTAGPIWTFRTEGCVPPEAPFDPQPTEDAIDVPVNSLLTWNGGGGGNCDEPCGVENGGFETGEFIPWVAVTGPGDELTPWNIGNGIGSMDGGHPFEGALWAQNGFDGSDGLYYDLYQETTIPACAPSAILTWSERIQWDMVPYGATLPREYVVSVQPAGGGTPLAIVYTFQLQPGTQGDTGYVTHSVDLLDLAPSIAGQTVRINFHEYIPEYYTGPAQFDLDGISLMCGGTTLISTPQSNPEIEPLNVPDIDTLMAEYDLIRQAADLNRTEQETTDPSQAVSGASNSTLINRGHALTTTATQQVIDASDRGWWRNLGNHDANNKNTYTGWWNNLTSNSFFVFDLTSVPPGSFSDATLRLEIEDYYGPNASESLTIYDVSTPISVLTSSGTNNVAVFNDLESGNSYGNFTVNRTDVGSILEITLNSQALADISAATGGYLAVGLHNNIDQPSVTEAVRFSASGEARVHQLVLTTSGGGGGGGSADTYDVCLGTETNQMALVGSDLEEPSFNPCILDYETTYYWQVIAKNDCGQTAGPIWSFTTQSCQPLPEDGAVEVPINTLLEWSGPSGSGGNCDEPCGVENGGFETGEFTPWVAVTGPGHELTPWNIGAGDRGWFGGFPFEGALCAQNGFDGSAGLYYDLYQETTIPACAPSAILTWSERIQWSMGGSLPREYVVSVQPAGGGTPLAIVYSFQLQPGTRGDTGYVTHSVDLLELAPSIAGQTVRINFHEYIPETLTGPAQFDLDGISLVCGGQVQPAATQNNVVTPLRSTSDIDALSANYDQIRQQAIDTAQQTRSECVWASAVETQTVSPEISDNNVALAPSDGQIVNGDFETGSFDGWTLTNTTLNGTFVINDGTLDPDSPDNPLPPYSGNYSALSDMHFVGAYTLYQDVVLPSGTTSLTLEWADMIRNHAQIFVDPDQEFRVQVWDLNNQNLQTLFSTNPGDPLMSPWTERSADLMPFAGQTVRIAFTADVQEFFFNVHLDDIRIDTGTTPPPTTPVVYDVYLGTDPSQMEPVGADLEEPVFNPCILDYETTYYWQVIAKNDCGQTAGPIWSFTTEAWQPLPEDGAMEVPIDTLLEWNGPVGGGNCEETCGVENGGFETGLFAPWVAFKGPGGEFMPWIVYDGGDLSSEGINCAVSGFDGDAGLFYNLYQEVEIPGCAPIATFSWSEFLYWELAGGTLPREYTVSIQPSGGGAPLAILYSQQILPGTENYDLTYVTHSVDMLELAPSIAGQTVRINFHHYMPESWVGGALLFLDSISLTCGGEVLPSTPQVQPDTADVEAIIANYEQARQQAIEAAQQARNAYDWPSATTQSGSPATSPETIAMTPSAGQIVNGDFETGSFDGWTLLNIRTIPDIDYIGTFVINNGTLDPDSPDGPLSPYSGDFSAMTDMEGPGVYTIYQDVTLPTGTTSLTLHWADMIRNHYHAFEDPVQEFRVEVWSLNNQTLTTLFSTNPGDPLMTAWTERSADLSAFAGQTVRIAFTVDVQLFFFNVHLDNIRIETGSTPPPQTDPITYDVYCGLNPNDPNAWNCVGEGLDTPECDSTPEPNEVLRKGRVYYWQVVAKNECGEVTSPLWSFTTENTPPVADAGEDQTVFCWIDGLVNVTLDGSGSYDEDENPITYLWTWTIGTDTFTATGVSPTITLPAGAHTITLVVNDSIDDSQPDEVVITALPPVEISVNCTPKSLNCKSNGNWITAHFTLPAEYSNADIDTSAVCTLEPMGLQSHQLHLSNNEQGQGVLSMTFDRIAFCDLQPPLGFLQLTPTGRLTNGQYFYANDEIRILNNRMEHLLNLANNWLEGNCEKPHWCNGQDINADGIVDFKDFILIR